MTREKQILALADRIVAEVKGYLRDAPDLLIGQQDVAVAFGFALAEMVVSGGIDSKIVNDVFKDEVKDLVSQKVQS